MDTDILVEGFRISEEMHGLQYLRYIGDGDSSVFYRLKKSVRMTRLLKKKNVRNMLQKSMRNTSAALSQQKKGIYAK